jgi:hypothetical protein
VEKNLDVAVVEPKNICKDVNVNYSYINKTASEIGSTVCPKVWKHPNKTETNDFREKRKNRSTSVFQKLSVDGICLLLLMTERVMMSSEVFF